MGKGTIIDASLKQAQATSGSGRDRDARFTRRRGKTFYGYKGHIGVDQTTNIVHSVEFTPANIHDTELSADDKERNAVTDFKLYNTVPLSNEKE